MKKCRQPSILHISNATKKITTLSITHLGTWQKEIDGATHILILWNISVELRYDTTLGEMWTE